jgi:hypothetical protein
MPLFRLQTMHREWEYPSEDSPCVSHPPFSLPNSAHSFSGIPHPLLIDAVYDGGLVPPAKLEMEQRYE